MPEPRLLKSGDQVTQAASFAEADCIIVSSEAEAGRVIQAGADPARVVTIAPAVDRTQFNPEGDAAPGPDGKLRLLWISGGAAEAALPELERVASMPGVRVAGQVERPWLTRVDAPGPGWHRWADAVLFTGQPDVAAMARALACGRPCLAPDSDAAREVLTDQWDAILYSPQKLADAVARMADPGLRARLAAPARTSSERFDAAVVNAREESLMRLLTLKEWPRVSVVLPTYRRAHLIEAAVRNVLEQDYPNLELIVVNDGSPDDTRERLERLEAELSDPRLRVIHRENGGLPVALNTGFAAATGELWTWTSDDNAYKPGALRALARELLLNDHAGLVYAGSSAPAPEALLEGDIVGGCFLFRAATARAVGALDGRWSPLEAWDYWLRFAQLGALLPLRRKLASGTGPSAAQLGAADVQAKRLAHEFAGQAGGHEKLLSHLDMLARYHKREGRRCSALSLGWRMVRLRPLRAEGWRAMLLALAPRARGAP